MQIKDNNHNIKSRVLVALKIVIPIIRNSVNENIYFFQYQIILIQPSIRNPCL